MSMTNLIEIKSNGCVVEIERGNVKVFSETSDGINVEMVNGMQLLYTNYNMPNETKRSIVNGFNTFVKAKKISIDLNNYRKPVTVLTTS